MRVTRPSGIVLAGGRATRFGADKLGAELNGRLLAHHAMAALAAVCGEVIVVVGPGPVIALPRGLLVPLRIVRDEADGEGPLIGAISGFEEATAEVVIVAGGDMPGLVPAVLDLLAIAAADTAFDGSALRNGTDAPPLPCALRRAPALAAARAIRAEGGSSLRALLRSLRIAIVAEAEWRGVDPEGMSLLDVDRPEDLEAVRHQS